MASPGYLIDTNILLRIARRDDPDHGLVTVALVKIAEGGAVFYYTHQNIVEFWNVATRPTDRNGFGLTIEEAEQETRVIERAWCFSRTMRPSITNGGGSFLHTRSAVYRYMTLDWLRR